MPLYLQVVFEGIRGKSWQGDIAIDEVKIENCGGGEGGEGGEGEEGGEEGGEEEGNVCIAFFFLVNTAN